MYMEIIFILLSEVRKPCFQLEKPNPKEKIDFKNIASDINDPNSVFCTSDLSNSKMASYLHVFMLIQLKVMTNNFSSCNFLGEGEFGSVYKAFADDKYRPGLDEHRLLVYDHIARGSLENHKHI
ncbi:kinase family protein [Striga asiatica]|uniref:Kinase family protein n=1 Tax=Striga asiatica TaxID=4170 RepID=A0A5A7PYP4_STRAF|nr:kinase family protein [Striga asiatica]